MLTERSNPKEKTVLIVDDDESICAFLKALLEKEGFNIEIAYKGDAAVKIVQSKKIDLIILDWMMPILSGFEVLKILQADDHRSIPVFVITARVTDSGTAAMIKQEVNVVEFITKPIQHAVFASRVHQILNTLAPDELKISQQMEKKSYEGRF